MGAAPLALLLVGMVIPIAFLFLALLFDALTVVWVAYQLWHDEWSVSLWHGPRRIGHTRYWQAIHHH